MEPLDERDHQIILKNYSRTDDAKYISGKCSPLGEGMPGFMGDYFILEVVFQEKNLQKKSNFFVKALPSFTELQTNIAESRNCYEKEIFFYDHLVKEFKKHGFDTSFAPEFYYCKNNKTLVMENLISNKYVMSEKGKIFDIEQMKCGLKSLALFHSASILYEEKMSKKLGQNFRLQQEYPDLLKENYMDSEDEMFGKILFESTLECVKYVAKNDQKIRYKDFEKHCDKNSILRGFNKETNLRKAIGHGDLWCNNLFFKYQSSNAVHCKIIDFQILRYNAPTLDVLLFIYVNTDEKFRASHMKKLLLYYYDSMTEIFAQHGFSTAEIFPLKDYEESLKFVAPTALFCVFCMGKLIFLPPEIMDEFSSTMFGNENWGRDFLQVFIAAFKHETYKTLLGNIVDELYKSLIENNNTD